MSGGRSNAILRDITCVGAVFVVAASFMAGGMTRTSPGDTWVTAARWAGAPVLYIPVLFCCQDYFMEWPFLISEVRMLLLLLAALFCFMAPAVLQYSGLVQSGCWQVVAALACLLDVVAYQYMVLGPSPRSGSLAGKVCIITGCNAGIGYETAEAFARAGGQVVFACRSQEKAFAAMERVAKRIPILKDQLIFLELDVSSLASVRRFAQAFANKSLHLDVLVLNAGVMMSSRKLSEDGFEMTLASNLLGHFLLVQLLLPQLLAAEAEGAQPRIILVGSTFFYAHGAFDFGEAVAVTNADARCDFLARPFELFHAYGQSKLASMLFIVELSRRLASRGSRIPANAVHPGQCTTEVQRDMHPLIVALFAWVRPILLAFLKTARQGALNTVHVAVAPELATSDPASGGFSGSFLMRMQPARLTAASTDTEAARRLWDVATKLTAAPGW